MRFGVQLLEPWSFANNPITFKPMPDLRLRIREKLNHRVFHLFNNRVCKMYEGTLFGSPNKQLIEGCLREDYLPHMEVTSFIDDDDYFQMFSYDYLASKEFCPQDLNYFRDIAIAIDQLHAKGIVHSDIRLQNMLFLEDGRGKLIDFDLACKENTPYPDNFNEDFPSRSQV